MFLSNIRNSQRWGLPLLTLSTYLRFWSVICYIVTFWLVFFEKEVSLVALLPHIQSVMSCCVIGQGSDEDEMSIKNGLCNYMGHLQAEAYVSLCGGLANN